MEIANLRQEIDQIDDELVHLFVKRMAIAKQVAEYKKANNLPIYAPAREQEKLLDVAAKAGPEMNSYIHSLYAAIFEISKSYQAKCISQDATQPAKPEY